MNPFQVLKTLAFLSAHAQQRVTYSMLYDHIMETWGAEIMEKLRAGSIEINQFLDYLQCPDNEKTIWINRFNQFLEKLRAPQGGDLPPGTQRNPKAKK